MDVSDWEKISEISEKVGYRWFTQKTFRDPAGKERAFTTFSRPGGLCVATIALTHDNSVVIARQFRQGPEAIFDELPGGGVEEDEDLAAAAARELAEETGYTTTTPLEYLGKVYRDAYTNDTNHYYLAVDCEKGGAHPDDGEYIDIQLISISALLENAKSGKMSDAAGVLLAYDALQARMGARNDQSN